MPEHVQYEDDDLFNPETRHEPTDVPVRPLWWAMIIFVIFAIVSHVALWFLYKAFVQTERNRAERPQTGIARPAGSVVPQNQPLLQPFPKVDPAGTPVPPNADTPVSDMVRMRRAEDEALRSYGWVDKEQGIVRIPIDIAKGLVVSRTAIREQTAAGAAAIESAPATTTAAPAPAATATPATTTAPATTTTPATTTVSPDTPVSSEPPPTARRSRHEGPFGTLASSPAEQVASSPPGARGLVARWTASAAPHPLPLSASRGERGLSARFVGSSARLLRPPSGTPESGGAP